MKTAFLIQRLSSGGAERAAVSLASQMREKGEDVSVITFSTCESFYEIDPRVRIINLELQDIEPGRSFSRISGCIKRALEIRRKIKAQQLDVLICMSTVMNIYGLLSVLFTKTKVVGTERNNPYKYKADKLNAWLKKITALFLDGFVFQTKAASEYYAKSVRKKGTVIQNAVYNPIVNEIPLCKERQKIVYGVGRLSKQKRFYDLIEAYSLLEKEHGDYRLVIFGEGEEREYLQNLINSYGLSEKILLPGADKNALRFVARGCAFVLTSEYEGMPNVLMEAMAVGTPCVSVRCKMGPEELIQDGINGILVPVGSVNDIKNGIKKIIENKDLSHSLSENGRKIIDTNSISSITDKWIEYIKRIKN